jgi:GrpB-like predicted nucleotidyltransferase (UPF0157 family)
VVVNSFGEIMPLIPLLEKAGFIHRPHIDEPWQVYFSCGDEQADTRTYHIHIVKTDSKEWWDYINFRDYLNANLNVAKEYEAVKMNLMAEYKNDRLSYTNVKAEFIQGVCEKYNQIK